MELRFGNVGVDVTGKTRARLRNRSGRKLSRASGFCKYSNRCADAAARVTLVPLDTSIPRRVALCRKLSVKIDNGRYGEIPSSDTNR
jgi:hypothetical protein